MVYTVLRRETPLFTIAITHGAGALSSVRSPRRVFLAPPQSMHLLLLSPVPLAVILTDGGAPAALASAPDSVVLADGGAPAVLALAPHWGVVLADGSAPAVLAFAPASVVLADGGAPAVFTLIP